MKISLKEIIIKSLILIFFNIVSINIGNAQKIIGIVTPEYIDSLSQRIIYIEAKLPQLKASRDPSLYYLKRELDHTKFAKAVEEWIYDEDLEKAKELCETRLERAKLRNDKASIQFFDIYKDRINKEIKYQKIRYQELFTKEKYFKKKYYSIIKEGNLESFKKAKRITLLAMKFAKENNLNNTIEYLNTYLGYTEAKIFDLESSYDLENLTRDQKDFEKLFIPLLSSDSLHRLEEAEQLVDNCYFFSANSKSLLDTNYFAKQKQAVTTAISDFINQADNPNAELAVITDKSITARHDSLNSRGVYKWGEYIVVINNFVPSSNYEKIRIGEAILHADKALAKYIEKNDLGRLQSGDKMGQTFIIKYNSSENGEKDFFYDEKLQSWQYMICYTQLVNSYFTKQVTKYLPPIKFINEDPKKVADSG